MVEWVDAPKEALRLEEDGKIHVVNFLLPSGRVLTIWSRNIFPMTDIQIIDAVIE